MIAIRRGGLPERGARSSPNRCAARVTRRRSRPAADYPIVQLAGIDAQVFTDFLLHDMGPALARLGMSTAGGSLAGRNGAAQSACAHRTFLHDGRASSIEDAVLQHDGQRSEARGSVDHFRARPADRQVLFDYVERSDCARSRRKKDSDMRTTSFSVSDLSSRSSLPLLDSNGATGTDRARRRRFPKRCRNDRHARQRSPFEIASFLKASRIGPRTCPVGGWDAAAHRRHEGSWRKFARPTSGSRKRHRCRSPEFDFRGGRSLDDYLTELRQRRYEPLRRPGCHGQARNRAHRLRRRDPNLCRRLRKQAATGWLARSAAFAPSEKGSRLSAELWLYRTARSRRHRLGSRRRRRIALDSVLARDHPGRRRGSYLLCPERLRQIVVVTRRPPRSRTTWKKRRDGASMPRQDRRELSSTTPSWRRSRRIPAATWQVPRPSRS